MIIWSRHWGVPYTTAKVVLLSLISGATVALITHLLY